MEIREFCVVLRAVDFERTCRFYDEVLSLPRLRSWQNESRRGSAFQAGGGVIEILDGETPRPRDPRERPTLQLRVASAEQAFAELQGREPNLPGGLLRRADATLVFETRDPDGVRILLVSDA